MKKISISREIIESFITTGAVHNFIIKKGIELGERLVHMEYNNNNVVDLYFDKENVETVMLEAERIE